MGVESLNEDTLALIVSHLDSADARKLSSTAHLFYTTARDRALGDVKIHSFSNAVKFCNYMLRDRHDCLPLLRTLRVQCIIENAQRLAQQESRFHEHSEDEYRAGAVLLADLLEEIPEIRVLVLYQAEVWMMYERRIVTIVSAMCSLDELEFTDIGPQVSDTLHDLKSTPRKLALANADRGSRRVKLDSDFGRKWPGWPLWSTLKPANSAPHMWRLDPEGLSFPSVRVLAAHAPGSLPPSPDLARIFPNVREVDFGDGGATTHFPIFWAPGQQHQRAVDWPTLETVHATGLALKWWKNAHPVHCLELLSPLKKVDDQETGTRGLNPAAEREDALMAAKNVQPVALIATLSTRLRDRYMRSLFTSSRRLRYVSAEVLDVRQFQTWLPDLQQWWGYVQKALSRYPRVVCLKVRCSVSRATTLENPTQQTSLDPMVGPVSYPEALQTVLAALPQWATSIPTLRYLSLDLRSTSPTLREHHGDQAKFEADEEGDLHWWQIDGGVNERMAKPLASSQGERIAAFLCSSRYDWQAELDTQSIA
ncbi:uncharacterized protein C8Q71DRAFT_785878 [Rhodofomes roseus]|uniref:F-box domain-containing protein n=1 Tax=Rhodofomes roseus TaxID=34475 RepID=A0ABQ8K177_9APHY|nr:uncharacterized protein C8Q71DRAFT_785878 [Rhodofomes roseus]KAH9830449.1 hypothetical protein C8Q71DRAFT_785878 [Rhodofomes roseus]